MKKVLFGLLALSSMAMAVDLGAEATNHTNVFSAEQEGAINVEGIITTGDAPAVVKYVVFASGDEGATQKGSLNLPNFVLSATEPGLGFEETPDKVFVKRVVTTEGVNSIADLEEGDNVQFKASIDEYYTNLGGLEWFGVGQEKAFEPTNFLSKTTLEGVIDEAAIDGLYVTRWGTIRDNEHLDYRSKTSIKFKSEINGEMIVENKTPDAEYTPMTNETTINAITSALTGGEAISNTKVLVRVN